MHKQKISISEFLNYI